MDEVRVAAVVEDPVVCVDTSPVVEHVWGGVGIKIEMQVVLPGCADGKELGGEGNRDRAYRHGGILGQGGDRDRRRIAGRSTDRENDGLCGLAFVRSASAVLANTNRT